MAKKKLDPSTLGEIELALDKKTLKNPDFKAAWNILKDVKFKNEQSNSNSKKKSNKNKKYSKYATHFLIIVLLEYNTDAATTQRKEFIEIIKFLLPYSDLNEEYVPKHNKNFHSTAAIVGLKTLDSEIIQLLLNSDKIQFVEESKTEGLHFSYVKEIMHPKKPNEKVRFTLLDIVIQKTVVGSKNHQDKLNVTKMILDFLKEKYPKKIKEFIEKPKNPKDPITALLPSVAVAGGDKYYDFLVLIAQYSDQYSLSLFAAVKGFYYFNFVAEKTINFLLEKGARADFPMKYYSPEYDENSTLLDYIIREPKLESIRDLFLKTKHTTQLLQKTQYIHILCRSVSEQNSPAELKQILDDHPEMLDLKDDEDLTPLFRLVLNKPAYEQERQLRLKMIEILLDKGATLEGMYDGSTLIQCAIKLEDIETFELILNKYPHRLKEFLFEKDSEGWETYVLVVFYINILNVVIHHIKSKDITLDENIIINYLIVSSYVQGKNKAFDLITKSFPDQKLTNTTFESTKNFIYYLNNNDDKNEKLNAINSIVTDIEKSLYVNDVCYNGDDNYTQITLVVKGMTSKLLSYFLNRAEFYKGILWFLNKMREQGTELTFLDKVSLANYIICKVDRNSEYFNSLRSYLNSELILKIFPELKGSSQELNCNSSSMFFNIAPATEGQSPHAFFSQNGYSYEEFKELKKTDKGTEKQSNLNSTIFANPEPIQHTWFDGALSSYSSNVKPIEGMTNTYFCLDEEALKKQGVSGEVIGEFRCELPKFHNNNIKTLQGNNLSVTLHIEEGREYGASFISELKYKGKEVSAKHSPRVLIAKIKADETGATLYYACYYTRAFHNMHVFEGLKQSLKCKSITIYPTQMENTNTPENKNLQNLN